MVSPSSTSSETHIPDPVKPKRPRRLRRYFLFIFLGLLSACILITAISALSNLILPSHSKITARLSDLDKARLAEAFHLRSTLGDMLWPGWGQADIPAILYNEKYAFLVGYPDPPPGWVKVPQNTPRGGPWLPVPGDTFDGQVYYRQLLPASVTPQAFAVMVGDQWVSSMTTRDWMEIELGNQFKGGLPPILRPIFPYRGAGRLFLSAAAGKDGYIAGLLHESFHAYEGMLAPQQLLAAESSYNQYEYRYPWEDATFHKAWQAELNILAEAVHANTDGEAAGLASQFLAQRQQRRTAANLDPVLVDLERQKEWEEGLAKYTELAIWRLAATTPGYQPLLAMSADQGFKAYANYQNRWSQEMDQIWRLQNGPSDNRFYYSGFAQAVLLDRLSPGWRAKALANGVYLEDLLSAAVNH